MTLLISAVLGTTGAVGLLSSASQSTGGNRLRRRLDQAQKLIESMPEGLARSALEHARDRDTTRLAAQSLVRMKFTILTWVVGLAGASLSIALVALIITIAAPDQLARIGAFFRGALISLSIASVGLFMYFIFSLIIVGAQRRIVADELFEAGLSKAELITRTTAKDF